jgi:hypothetical protein
VNQIEFLSSNYENINSLFYFTSSENSSLAVENYYIHDVGLYNGVSTLTIGDIANVNMQNLTFENVYPVEISDTTNYLINFNKISTTMDATITMSDININLCQITLFIIGTSSVSSSVAIEFTMTDVSVTNLNFPFKDDIIVTSNIVSDALIDMTFDNMVFQNVSFDRGGDLILFSHQQNQALQITNSHFSDIVNAGIKLTAFNNKLANTNRTKVSMDNITASQIDAQTTWFISVFEGADIEISNSSFNKISSRRTGSVIYAGYKKATVTITDSTFVNNTAIEGGVMNVQSSSKIVCNN